MALSKKKKPKKQSEKPTFKGILTGVFATISSVFLLLLAGLSLAGTAVTLTTLFVVFSPVLISGITTGLVVTDLVAGGGYGVTALTIIMSLFKTIWSSVESKDEEDGIYSPEWWGGGHTVSRSTSAKGNGVVSVVAHPSSLPSRDSWGETERWLEKRYMEIMPSDGEKYERFKVLGYQWRSLRFNEDTRQSTVKVMAACKELQPSSIFYMQQPHCLDFPCLKSMVAVGLTSLAASKYDIRSVAIGKKQMRILIIGHGGGSLPLFLAHYILGAVVDIVEIDPLVISESVQTMGFPAFSVMTGAGKRALPTPDIIDQVMWRGIHERLFLYESEAEEFILKNPNNSYDLIVMDAYDGANIFPHSLWDSDSVFMKALSERLHREHGTLVANLHSDEGATTGKYVMKVGRAYKKGLIENERNGLVFACEVPWLCNVSLVVSRGMRTDGRHGDKTMSNLMKTSLEVDRILRLPFSCLDYLKTGIAVI